MLSMDMRGDQVKPTALKFHPSPCLFCFGTENCQTAAFLRLLVYVLFSCLAPAVYQLIGEDSPLRQSDSIQQPDLT